MAKSKRRVILWTACVSALVLGGTGTATGAVSALPGEVTITSISPTVGAPGTSVMVSGTGFGTTAAEDVVTINGKPSTVTTATATTLQVTIPSGATSGVVKVSSPSGTAISPADLFIPPAPFVPADVAFSARATSSGVVASIPTSGKVALLTFSGVAGDRFAVQLSTGTFGTSTSSAKITIYRPSGTAQVAATGFANAGLWLDTFTLTATGSYTILVDPQGTATGQVTVSAMPVPADAIDAATPDGSAVVVATAAPGQNGAVTFSGTANQRVSIELTSGTYGTSTNNAKVSVLKPDGTALLAATGFANAGLFLEPLRLPVAGTYKVAIDPATNLTGQVTVKLNDVPEDPVLPGTAGGPGVTVSTTAPGQNAAVTFTGSANQKVSLQLSGSSYGSATSSAKVALLKPDGSSLVGYTGFGSAGFYVDAVTLPVAGLYKVAVDPQGVSTGGVTVAVNDATDATAPITPGGAAVAAVTPVAGQNSRLTFSATAGDRFSLELTDSTYGSSTSSAKVSVLNPSGTALVAARGFGTVGTYVDTTTITTTGVHTVLVDPQGAATGQVTVRLNAVPADPVVPVTIDGGPVSIATSVAGQNAAGTFTGTADQHVTIQLSASTFGTSTSSATVALTAPNGAVVLAARGFGTDGTLMDAVLPQAGTYRIAVDPSGTLTGSVAVEVLDSPENTALATPGGDPVTVSTSVAGQNASVAFDATAGQSVSVLLTASTFGSSSSSAKVSVLKPDGTVVVAARGFGTSGTFIDTFAIATTGRYKVFIDPQGSITGGVTVQVHDVPADDQQTTTPGGTPATVTTTVPGHNGAITFPGTTGQRISLQLTDSTYGSSSSNLTVSVLKPDGTTLVSGKGVPATGTFIDTVTLPTTGTYKIVVDPQSTVTGHVTAQVNDVPADDQQTTTPGGTPATVTTTVPGHNGAITFPGTTGQRISLQLTDSTYGSSSSNLTVSVLKPDGTTLVSGKGVPATGTFIDTVTLPTTGTYKIVVDPQSTVTGHVTAQVNDVPADDQQTTTPGGTPATVTTTVPGHNGAITFPGTTGQRISLQLTDSTYGSSSSNLTVSVLKPDGTTLVSGKGVPATGTFIDTVTLPTTGTYKIVVDPQSTVTGHVTAQVNDVPADVSGTISPGGDFLTVTTTVPGQNVELTAPLEAATPYRIRVDRSASTATVRAFGPTGATVESGETASAPDDVVSFTTTSAGDHRIVLDPSGAAVGSWRLELYTRVGSPRISSTTPENGWSASSSVHATWSVDADGSLSGYAVAVDDAPTTVPAPTVTQTGSTYNGTLADGIHWLHVRALRSTGQVGNTAHYRLAVDSTKPSIADLASPTNPEGTAGPADVTVQWTGSDSDSGIAGYSYTMSPGQAADVDMTVDLLPASWHDLVTSDGMWFFSVRAVDAAGNWGDVEATTLVVDGTAPGTPVVSSASHPSEDEAYESPVFLASWKPAATWDDVTAWAVDITDDPEDEPVTVSYATTIHQVLEPGVWYLHVRAQDSQGRWSPTVHRRVEVAPFQAAVISPVAGQLVWGDQTVEFTCPTGTEQVQVSSGAPPVLLSATVLGDGTCTASWDTDALDGTTEIYPAGTWTIQVVDEEGAPLGSSVDVRLSRGPSVADALTSLSTTGAAEPVDVMGLAYAAMLAGDQLPDDLAALAEGAGGLGELGRLVTQTYSQLSPAQRAEFDLRGPGDEPARPGGLGAGHRSSSGNPDCDADDLVYNLPIPNHVGIEIRFDCVQYTGHFRLAYNDDDFTGRDSDSVPIGITEHALALEHAYSTYADLGFEMPKGHTPVFYAPEMGTSGLSPWPGLILMGPHNPTYDTNNVPHVDHFLPEHEFFHIVQWEYYTAIDYAHVSDFDNLWWWSESSANWAARKANDQDTDGYTQELNKFLARTDKQFDEAEETFLGPEYGASPVELFLEQQIDPDAVLDIMDDIAYGYLFVDPPTEVIEDYLDDHGTSYETQIERFRWSTYLLDEQFGLGFDAGSVAKFRQRLATAEPGEPQLPQARAPFEAHSIIPGAPVEGSVELESSGSKFIEIRRPAGRDGTVVFHVTANDDDTRVSAASEDIDLVSSGVYAPALCQAPARVGISNGFGSFEVHLTAGCPVAVLHINSTDRTSDGIDEEQTDWSATFNPDHIGSTNLELGVTPMGGLITGNVGLQRTDTGAEVLAHGCACEGWGIRSASPGFGGSTVDAGDEEGPGLWPVEFSTTSSTAHTLTRVGGAFGLLVSHDFSPSANPDLYRVDVSISNVSPTTWTDVHYRRAFDWDVDPTPFDEFVSWGKRPNTSDTFVTYTSDDGFANPDPAEPVSFINAEGYFQDSGPADAGGLIDVKVGDIAPDETRTFTFYYGISLSEADAIAAIDEVGAQVYSLGQPNVPGAAESGSPVTAIFAIDGTNLLFPIEVRPFDAAEGTKSPFRPRVPSRPLHGVHEENTQHS